MSRDGSIVFTPKRIGSMLLQNRFMRSATWEALADEEGRVKDSMINLMETLAYGTVGLIVPGAVYCNRKGQGLKGQSGLCTPDHLRRWTLCVDKVHEYKSKLAFQIIHNGLASDPKLNGGFEPEGPTSFNKNQHELTNAEIEDLIQDFVDSAKMAYQTGADGAQLHAAHGYLLSGFLSPALNHRKDKWGGSTENRLRIINEIVDEIRKSIPKDAFSLSIKMNGDDCTKGGVTPELAAEYVHLLEDKLDLFEISCGVGPQLFTIRSTIDEASLIRGQKKENHQAIIDNAKEATKGAEFIELYNRYACKIIRKKNPNANLALVGGIRKFTDMNEIIQSGDADIVSISRPFLNDPYFIMRFKANTLDQVLCTSCGACILSTEKGIYCHMKR